MADFLGHSRDYLLFSLVVLGVCCGVAGWLRRKRTPVRLSRAFWLALAALLLAGFFYVDAVGRRPQQRLIALFQGIAPTYADELSRHPSR